MDNGLTREGRSSGVHLQHLVIVRGEVICPEGIYALVGLILDNSGLSSTR